jgi:hypothetical protein
MDETLSPSDLLFVARSVRVAYGEEQADALLLWYARESRTWGELGEFARETWRGYLNRS